MTKRALLFCAALLGAGAGLYGACEDNRVSSNCQVKCDDADNTCLQKCTDDACRTVCRTDLDTCTASCESVTAMPISNDGGGSR